MLDMTKNEVKEGLLMLQTLEPGDEARLPSAGARDTVNRLDSIAADSESGKGFQRDMS